MAGTTMPGSPGSSSMESLLGYLLFSVGINLLLFLFAFVLKTDKLTDISYSLTFLAITVYAWLQSDQSVVANVLALGVIFWGLRLGAYLLYRIQQIGGDSRFDEIRSDFKSFFLFWLMQGLTCFLVMIPVVKTLENAGSVPTWVFWAGTALAALGWALEAVADAQKFRFKLQNEGTFMRGGVWSYLQHPNYAGELLFWWSVCFSCLPYAPWYIIVGPLWITWIILRFSGIPRLQEQWEKKYGGDPAFRAYQATTWKLIPGIY